MGVEQKSASCRLCDAKVATLLELPDTPAHVQTLLSPEAISADHAVDLELCRCPRCGLVQLAGEPDLGRLYSADYLCSVNFSAHARQYQEDLVRRWAGPSGGVGRRVLEVGGGDGFFAALLQAEGFEVTLIDPAPKACRVARERGIARVIEGYLDDQTFSGETFDAVVARHVLEHVTRPIDFLSLLNRHLRPGGQLLVEIPNLDGIVHNRRFQDFYAEHLSYFDPRSLTAALVGAGFEVLETYTIEKGDYLVGVARVPNQPLEGMLVDLRRFVDRFRAMADESRRIGRRFAIYGAGGRCVALLSLIGARDLDIAYVVDSDAKKWGQMTPVTHLRVVSPDTLRTDPVDDLVVAATAFQDEIVRQLAWFPREGRRLGVVQPEPRWLAAEEMLKP